MFGISVLGMPFVENTGVDGIQLHESCQVDVGDDSIENEVEMLVSIRASVDIVEGSNAVEVINILAKRVKDLVRVLSCQCRDLLSSFPYV